MVSSNFPSNAIGIMSGNPFLIRVMTIFIKHIFLEEGRKGGRKEGRKGGREEERKGGREEGRKEGRKSILFTGSFSNGQSKRAINNY